MKVGLRTARPLGWAVAQHIKENGGDVVDHIHIADGWWGRAGIPLDFVGAVKPDFYLSVLWPDIIPPHALKSAPWLNLHPAPLPEYRGCNSYAHAIINGEREYGVTLHYMDEGVDTGPIIESRRFPLLPAYTGKRLHDVAQLHALEMFRDWWPVLRGGLPPATVQPAEGRYYRRDSLEPYFGSPDPTVRRALTFPPFDNGYGEAPCTAGSSTSC
jgi:hypothetical protein